MPVPDHVERLLGELVLFRSSAKKAPLTEEQWQLVKLKLYDLIFDMESNRPPS